MERRAYVVVVAAAAVVNIIVFIVVLVDDVVIVIVLVDVIVVVASVVLATDFKMGVAEAKRTMVLTYYIAAYYTIIVDATVAIAVATDDVNATAVAYGVHK